MLTLVINKLKFIIERTLFNWSPYCDGIFAKGPIVQLLSDRRAVIIWETCEPKESAFISWGGEPEQNVQPLPVHLHFLHRATMFQVFRDGNQVGNLDLHIRHYPPDPHPSQPITINFPPYKDSSVRIVAVGDNQTGHKTFTKMLPTIIESKANVFLHLGDMVQQSFKNYDWDLYFFKPLMLSGILSKMPFILTHGNHDIEGGVRPPYFPPLKSFPEGGRTGYYFALTIGPARIIVLDTNSQDDAQLDWLEEELKSSESENAAFRIVSVHIPPFIEFWGLYHWHIGEWRWPDYIRERAVPIFEKYKVNLVLSGHQHNYQRGFYNGVTYITAGGGGGELDFERVTEYNVYEKTIIEHHFLLIDIDTESINITMHQLDGSVGDTLIIPKDALLQV